MTEPRPANPPQPATETRSDTRMTAKTHNADSHTQPTGETKTMTDTNANANATQETGTMTPDANARPKLKPGRLDRIPYRYMPNEGIVNAFKPDEAFARAEKSRDKYLEDRRQLRAAAENEATIIKLKTAAERQRDEATQNWQREFRENLGSQSKSLRSQCKAEREWQIEAEQQAQMLEQIQPQMEWLRLNTQVSRELFNSARRDAQEVWNQHELYGAMERLFDSDEGETVASHLQELKDRIETDLCNNIPYMLATFGADVSLKPGTHIKVYLNREQWGTLEAEVEMRYLAALGELVQGAVPRDIKPAKHEKLAPLSALDFEDGRNIYETQIGRVRRAKELQAQLQIPD